MRDLKARRSPSRRSKADDPDSAGAAPLSSRPIRVVVHFLDGKVKRGQIATGEKVSEWS